MLIVLAIAPFVLLFLLVVWLGCREGGRLKWERKMMEEKPEHYLELIKLQDERRARQEASTKSAAKAAANVGLTLGNMYMNGRRQK